MSRHALLAMVLSCATLAMADAGYKLRIDSSLKDGQLSVVPRIAAPAGARLRYEMVSSKQGGAGTSSTSQSGNVSVGADGSAQLATLRVGVGPQDKYVFTVKVFDGAKLVAEEVLRHPQ